MSRKFVLLVPLVAAAFFFCSMAESEACRRRSRAARCQTAYPLVTGPCVESATEATGVPQPSCPSCPMVEPFLPQPHIALDPLPGTGSKSPTGVLNPKVEHKIDPDTMKQLKELLNLKLQPGPVHITPQLEDATTQRISRISQIVEGLLWLGSVMLGGSLLSKLGPWVAPVARGLLSVLEARSNAPNPTPGDSSSNRANGS